jgi:hypothetical protein
MADLLRRPLIDDIATWTIRTWGGMRLCVVQILANIWQGSLRGRSSVNQHATTVYRDDRRGGVAEWGVNLGQQLAAPPSAVTRTPRRTGTLELALPAVQAPATAGSPRATPQAASTPTTSDGGW